MEQTVPAVLAAAAAECGSRLAVVSESSAITYAEAAAGALRLARGLAAAGIEPGDRVAIWLPNGPEWAVAHWASAYCGAVVVPINTRNRPPEVHYMLAQSGAAALITTTAFRTIDFLAGVRAALDRGLPELKLVVVSGSDGEPLPPPVRSMPAVLALGAAVAESDIWRRVAAVCPDDLHLILFTSGTTGYPKGAMLTHDGLMYGARSYATELGVAPGEAIFAPNPMSHVMGINFGRLMPAMAGATLVTMAAFDVAGALRLLADHRVVFMSGTPSHYQMLAEHPDLNRYDLSALRGGLTGGATLTPAGVKRIRQRLGLTSLINGLGMSEASGGISRSAPDDPPEVMAASVGHPVPWLKIRVVDPDTGVDRAPGAVGELWLRGPSVTRGYFRQPDATAAAFTADGWFRTGDLVRQDTAGYLYFEGRLKEMFTVGGFNVYPAEVERVLTEHPAVAEAQVVGVPDDRLGEVAFACVRLHPGAEVDEAGLLAHCRERLANYKVPRYLRFMTEFPRLATGKVQKSILRQQALEWVTHSRAGIDPLHAERSVSS